MEFKYLPLPLLNQIGKVDQAFIWIVVGAVLLGVAFYFLIPLFNRKRYAEARENLKRREAALQGQRKQTETKPEDSKASGEDGKDNP